MRAHDESAISEITILPDGRICLFGASRQVLETLDAIRLGGPALRRRLNRLRAAEGECATSLGESRNYISEDQRP